MHKQIVICGDPAVLQQLGAELRAHEGIVSLALQQGASVEPRGDVLTVYTLNRSGDDVLRQAAPAVRAGRVRIVLGASSAFLSSAHHELIAKDDDEALWEEMESQLRNHGRISVNYLLLMVLGGAISAGAFTLEPVGQAIATVGASITSPGFEPLAKIAQGVVLRRSSMVVHGALAALAGYAVLLVGAAATFALLAALDEAKHVQLLTNPFAKALTAYDVHSLLPSFCAAVAGGVMVASLRDTYVVGPLMVMALIPAAALVGASLAMGDFALAGKAAARAGLDMLAVILLVALVLAWKQRTKHRRSLLP
jgi:hypothetical protein